MLNGLNKLKVVYVNCIKHVEKRKGSYTKYYNLTWILSVRFARVRFLEHTRMVKNKFWMRLKSACFYSLSWKSVFEIELKIGMGFCLRIADSFSYEFVMLY